MRPATAGQRATLLAGISALQGQALGCQDERAGSQARDARGRARFPSRGPQDGGQGHLREESTARDSRILDSGGAIRQAKGETVGSHRERQV